MSLPRSALAATLLCAAAIPVAGCGEDRPLGKDEAGPAKVSDDTTTAQLMTNAVDDALPSVVAVSVTRGGVTATGTGTVLTGGYVVTDAALVGGSAPQPASTPKPAPPRRRHDADGHALGHHAEHDAARHHPVGHHAVDRAAVGHQPAPVQPDGHDADADRQRRSP